MSLPVSNITYVGYYMKKEQIIFTFFGFLTIIGVGILFCVLLLMFYTGREVLSWRFLTSPWSHGDISQGGIYQALIGSVYIGVGVMLISFPLGLGTAIYLTEYNTSGIFKRVIELAIRNLAGIPSVVFGMFGLALFVNFFNFGTSLLSAILTLSAMTLPWIITSSVESLESVPRKFRESSLALGATRWQTIWRVVLPAALSGSITGGVVSVARVLGETAPVIMVGATFYLSELPNSLTDKFMALPYHTFILATQHASPLAKQYASATSLVLIVLTFFLSFGAIIIRSYFRSQKDW